MNLKLAFTLTLAQLLALLRFLKIDCSFNHKSRSLVVLYDINAPINESGKRPAGRTDQA